jgi:carbonic anhydrase
MSATDDLLANNRAYAAGFVDGGWPTAPSLQLTVVTCMDSRIDVFSVLGLRTGEAHTLRNAGGVVTGDVLRSLLISQRLLGTREVMLLHHTGCGLLTFDDEQLADQVERDTGARPPLPLGAITDLDESVRRSLAAVRDCAYLPHRDSVRGFVYELPTGALREVT